MLKEEFEKKAGLKISPFLDRDMSVDYVATGLKSTDEYIKTLLKNPSVKMFINECQTLRKDLFIYREADRNAAKQLLAYQNECAIGDEDARKLQVIIEQLLRLDEIVKIKLTKGYILTKGERDWIYGVINNIKNGEQG